MGPYRERRADSGDAIFWSQTGMVHNTVMSVQYRGRMRRTCTGPGPKKEYSYKLQPRGRRTFECREVSNTTHGDRDTFFELRVYIGGAAVPARICRALEHRMRGDVGTSALAVVIIDTFTSLHLPPSGTRPIGWCRCSPDACGIR